VEINPPASTFISTEFIPKTLMPQGEVIKVYTYSTTQKYPPLGWVNNGVYDC